jgi:hypothetical protein
MIYRVALAKKILNLNFARIVKFKSRGKKKIAWALHDIHSQAENAQFFEDNYLLLKILHFSKRIFES